LHRAWRAIWVSHVKGVQKMMSVKNRFGAPLLALGLGIASLLGGCVGQGEYDRLYETNASLTSRNKELTAQLEEQRQANELLHKSVGSGEGTLADLQKQNAELRKLLDSAMADYSKLGSDMSNLDFGKLDPVTSRALEAIASEYPDLIKFDSNRGMLRFSSDLTFDSGSATVKTNAKIALDALSKVLTSSSAAGYEVVVEGHTDSQKISSGTAKQHPTNRHLSAHRAISVIDELGKMGVGYDRMLAAGWGEYHPLVPNSSNGNTPQNRRVEIFLAKAHNTNTNGTTDTTAAAKTTAPVTKPTKTTKVDDIDITK
jgi:chemotaxis protein MotB